MKTIILIIVFLFPFLLEAQDLPIKVVPQPKEIYFRPNFQGFSFDSAAIKYQSYEDSVQFHNKINETIVRLGFKPLQGFTYEYQSSLYKNWIFIGQNSEELNSYLKKLPDVYFVVNQNYPGSEGYVIDVTKDIILNASNYSGMVNGIYTLLQLFEDNLQNDTLPSLRIIDAPDFPNRWVYYPTNLLVNQNVSDLKTNWANWRKLKLNAPYLTDYKFSFISDMPKRYLDSCTSVKNYGGSIDFNPVIGFFPFGYSNGMMYFNPNFAAGLPVKDQLFEMKNGQAVLQPTVDVTMPNGGFEKYNGNNFSGFAFIDDPGYKSFVDNQIKHSGTASIRFELNQGNSNYRICYKTKVSPFKQYHISSWVKTDQARWSSEAKITVLNKNGKALTYINVNIPTTTDWKQLDITVNSLDTDTLLVYWGIWGGLSGKIWWDDLKVEECAFVNLLRREGTPLNVNDQISGANFQENIDFDSLVDPKLGKVESYSGEYDAYHTPPILTATPTGKLKDGTKIAISYYHTTYFYDDQIMATTTDPKLYQQLESQFKIIDSLFKPKQYFFEHDEIRLLNWDYGDEQKKMTPAQLLADNVNQCKGIVKKYNSNAEISIWSDMFDEFHNAQKSNYYLVNGDLTGGADLLPKDLTIVNWNTQADVWQQSLDFFSSKGFSQMSAPFYDTDQNNIRIRKEQTRNTPNFLGMMYTTWSSDYSYIQQFSEYAWNHAPYILYNPVPTTSIPNSINTEFKIYGDWMDSEWKLENAYFYYRTDPSLNFDSIQVNINNLPNCSVGIVFQDTVLPYIEYYIKATDNRGWVSKVPFGINTTFKIDHRNVSVFVHAQDDVKFIQNENEIHIFSNAIIKFTEVYDIFGNLISFSNLTTIKTDNLQNGIYFIKVKIGYDIFIKKITIVR